MGQKKLQRFAELRAFDNVLEYPPLMQGKWKEHFGNTYPLVLELACGKGEYAVGLAALYPDKNFIGVDVKGNRMWVGARKASMSNLHNVAFLRTQIEMIHHYFGPGEVAEIWITFPDPQLRFSKAKKRLTHPRFLRLYQQFLAPGGVIHLKTDSPALYEFSKKVVELGDLTLHQDVEDVYAGSAHEALQIKTHYEQLDIANSNRVHYLQFSLDKPLPDGLDEHLKLWESETATTGRR